MILLTAFKGNYNSSKVLIDQIINSNCNKLLLTNSFTTCENEIARAVIKQKPKYILSFGQKPNTDKLYIETTACRNGSILNTNFDIGALEQSLKIAEIPYRLSSNAGYYLCNHVYFSGLDIIKQQALNTKMIFVHVPSMKDFSIIDIVSKWLNKHLEELE